MTVFILHFMIKLDYHKWIGRNIKLVYIKRSLNLKSEKVCISKTTKKNFLDWFFNILFKVDLLIMVSMQIFFNPITMTVLIHHLRLLRFAIIIESEIKESNKHAIEHRLNNKILQIIKELNNFSKWIQSNIRCYLKIYNRISVNLLEQ